MLPLFISTSQVCRFLWQPVLSLLLFVVLFTTHLLNQNHYICGELLRKALRCHATLNPGSRRCQFLMLLFVLWDSIACVGGLYQDSLKIKWRSWNSQFGSSFLTAVRNACFCICAQNLSPFLCPIWYYLCERFFQAVCYTENAVIISLLIVLRCWWLYPWPIWM